MAWAYPLLSYLGEGIAAGGTAAEAAGAASSGIGTAAQLGAGSSMLKSLGSGALSGGIPSVSTGSPKMYSRLTPPGQNGNDDFFKMMNSLTQMNRR